MLRYARKWQALTGNTLLLAPGRGSGALVGREELRHARVIEVRDRPELERLERSLLGEREAASLVLTQQVETVEPVLPPQMVRTVVGIAPMIYFVAGDRPLRQLRATLGGALAPVRGSLRIYWPGVKVDADPFDHPTVMILDELPASSLEELARQFDLSRPRVRQEIKHIDQLRRTAECENTQLKAELSQARKALSRHGLAAAQRVLADR